jgi:hypothetical protein
MEAEKEVTPGFTESERIQIKAAKDMIAKCKAARRQRLADVNSAEAIALRAKKAEEIKAAIRAAEKKAFDNRVRVVLLEFTRFMNTYRVGILKDQDKAAPLGQFYPGGSNNISVFTMVDAEGKVPQATIRWVYGKGFEWN